MFASMKGGRASAAVNSFTVLIDYSRRMIAIPQTVGYCSVPSATDPGP